MMNNIQDTVLLRFIDDHIQQYREPERKGTAKGEPIGFSLRKYISILLSLTLLHLKEISELAEVSYGLLRVWRTENAYRNERDKSINQFSRFFIDSLVEHTSQSVELDAPSNTAYYPGPQMDFFSDIAIYHADVLQRIYDQVKVLDSSSSQSLMGGNMPLFLHNLSRLWSFRKGQRTASLLVSTSTSTRAEFRSNPASMGAVTFANSSKTFGVQGVFEFAEAMQKPWAPDVQTVEEVKAAFIDRLRR